MSDDFNTTPGPESEPVSEPAGDNPPTAEPSTAEPSGATASEAWADVVARMGDLGEAVSAWARAAADNPENRHHLDDVRASVNDIASKADAAFSQVASSEFGQQFKSGAEEAGAAIGECATKVGDAAAPHVASAFAGLASVFGHAAQRVEEAAARQKEREAGAEAASPAEPAAPPAAPEPREPPEPPAAPEPPARDE